MSRMSIRLFDKHFLVWIHLCRENPCMLLFSYLILRVASILLDIRRLDRLVICFFLRRDCISFNVRDISRDVCLDEWSFLIISSFIINHWWICSVAFPLTSETETSYTIDFISFPCPFLRSLFFEIGVSESSSEEGTLGWWNEHNAPSS